MEKKQIGRGISRSDMISLKRVNIESRLILLRGKRKDTLQIKKEVIIMEAIAETLHTEESEYPGFTTITSNLYELIATIGEEVEPDEDILVAEVVLHLLDTGQVIFLDADTNVNEN